MAVKHRFVECEQVGSRLSHLLRTLQTYHLEHGLPTQGVEVAKLCDSIVAYLGSISIPAETDEYMKFMSDLKSLEEILTKAGSGEFVVAILKSLYNAISNPQRQCSPTMSIVLQLADEELIPRAVFGILEAGYSEQNLQQALLTLCGWLSRWTFTPNLGILVLLFMEGLEAKQHYDILVEAATRYTEQLFKLMVLPEQRKCVAPVVLHMLSRVQHSPEVFHRIVPHVGVVCKSLASENSASSRSCLMSIVDLCTALMEHFAGYPNTYEPLRRVLVQFAEPRNERKQMLKCGSWSDVHLYNGDVVSGRQSSGKVGLNNLGNTCYMNSILQALFMTKKFRNDVLTANTAAPLLAKLQVLFALLQHSPRTLLSPNEILSLAKPPGFQPGHQHDSSEFLGYLLDMLHEQEKSSCSISDKSDIDVMSSSPSMDVGSSSTIVQRSFGGRLVTFSKCGNCDAQNQRADFFWELQLSFPAAPDTGEVPVQSVQTLLDYYFQPEKLKEDNQYHCEKCRGKTDGERVTRVAERPPRLVLTLKHFCFDSASQQRTKLLQRVELDALVQLEGGVTYELYAVVVHCGSNLDSGHYYTLARDGHDCWYKFNDCVVTQVAADALGSLRPPETPYILFYSRQDCPDPDGLPRTALLPRLEAAIAKDVADYESERQARTTATSVAKRRNKNDEPPPPGCGGGGGFSDISHTNRFVY